MSGGYYVLFNLHIDTITICTSSVPCKIQFKSFYGKAIVANEYKYTDRMTSLALYGGGIRKMFKSKMNIKTH